MSVQNLLTFRVMPKAKTSQEIKNFFGNWFQKEREKRGISQQFVAGKVDLSVTQLSRIENGYSGTRRDTVILLAQTIGADEEEALRVFYGNQAGNADPELIGFIRNELTDSDNWTQYQKDLFLQIIKVTVAGIQSQSDEFVYQPPAHQGLPTMKQSEFMPRVKPAKRKKISQQEFIVEDDLIEVEDKGTINIDKNLNKKVG